MRKLGTIPLRQSASDVLTWVGFYCGKKKTRRSSGLGRRALSSKVCGGLLFLLFRSFLVLIGILGFLFVGLLLLGLLFVGVVVLLLFLSRHLFLIGFLGLVFIHLLGFGLGLFLGRLFFGLA